MALLLAQSLILPAQYAIEPLPDATGAATKPAGASGTAITQPAGPVAKDARRPDLYEETLRTLTPMLSPEPGNNSARAVPPGAAPASMYGLGDAPPADAAPRPHKVPESLSENMPASFLGRSDDVKIKGDPSRQYNLPQSRPGVVTAGDSTWRAMAGLLGVVALAAWYAFQITKKDRGGPRRHRQRQMY